MKAISKLLLLLLFFSSSQKALDIKTYLKGLRVNDISSDRGGLWIATYGGGIYRLEAKDDSLRSYSAENGDLPMNFFYSVRANDEFVWAGSTDGLFILDRRQNRWTKRKFSLGGQLANWIRALAYDKNEDALWIGRFNYLTKLDLKKRRFTDYDLTVKENSKTNTVVSLALDGDSTLWVGTECGLHKLPRNREISAPDINEFYDNSSNDFLGEGQAVSVSDMAFSGQNLYIGTDQFVSPEHPDYNVGGIYKYDRKINWLKFDTKNGLDGNGIYRLLKIGPSILASLYQFSSETKEQYGRGLAVLDTRNDRTRMVTEESIPKSIYSMFFDKKYLWLGTDDGLLRITVLNDIAKWK